MTDGSIHESHYHSVHDIFGAKKVSVYRGIMILRNSKKISSLLIQDINLNKNESRFILLFLKIRKKKY